MNSIKNKLICRNCKYKKWGIFGVYCKKFDKWYRPLKLVQLEKCTVNKGGSAREKILPF